MYAGIQVPVSGSEPFTDFSRWRLLSSREGGRHTWHFLQSDEECEKWPQDACDRYWLGLDTVRGISLEELAFI